MEAVIAHARAWAERVGLSRVEVRMCDDLFITRLVFFTQTQMVAVVAIEFDPRIGEPMSVLGLMPSCQYPRQLAQDFPWVEVQ